MGKYDALWNRIKESGRDSAQLTFSEENRKSEALCGGRKEF